MATLTVQTIDEDGLVPSTTAAGAAGDVFANTGRELLMVTNGAGSPVTVTITAQVTTARSPGMGSVTKSDAGGAVAAGATAYFGPFPTRAFNNASRQVEVSYSDETSVTVAVMRLPEP